MTPLFIALHRHYAEHHDDRQLPWRRPGEPWDRVALVEGLLAQTRARQVAERYADVFRGITNATDWLALDDAERLARVAPLGLPKLKLGAVDGIARALVDGAVVWPSAMSAYCGLGPYTAGMVALLHGAEAIPVDANVERVGLRASRDGDPARWMAALLAVAMRRLSATGYPAAYEVLCAVLDIGATRCRAGVVECDRCPIRPWCAAAPLLAEQVTLGIPEPSPARRYRTGHEHGRGVNLGAQDGEVRDYRLEVGTLDPAIDLGRAVPESLQRIYGADAIWRDFGGDDPIRIGKRLLEALAPSEPSWARLLVDDRPGARTVWGGLCAGAPP